MIHFKTNLKTESKLIDLTPLVDVIFLLLIFFVLTSNLFPLKSLNIENPKIDKTSTPLTTQIIVAMDAQHVLYMGHKREIVDLSSVKEMVQKEMQAIKLRHPDAELSVVLSVDRRVEYGYFLKLFSLIQDCTSNIRLVYHSEEQPISMPSLEKERNSR